MARDSEHQRTRLDAFVNRAPFVTRALTAQHLKATLPIMLLRFLSTDQAPTIHFTSACLSSKLLAPKLSVPLSFTALLSVDSSTLTAVKKQLPRTKKHPDLFTTSDITMTEKYYQ